MDLTSIEGVLIEENRAACVVGHVEPICKNVMIYILRCLLQGFDVPFHRNLFFEFPCGFMRSPQMQLPA